MRLLRYGPVGQEKPGCLDADGNIRDLSGIISDIMPDTISPDSLTKLADIDISALPQVDANERLGMPLVCVPNIVAIGLNYADHARETKGETPPEPILFFKHTGSLSGPVTEIPYPVSGNRLDWEIELAVVIGSPTHRISEDQAMDHVAGYMLCNDVSERDAQIKRQGQWAKGKSAPGFCPIGPYLVTKDEIPDPQNLDLILSVNDEVMQDSSTTEMIFSVKYLVAYLSQFMRLLPGDIIATGTPAGVGLGRKQFLKPGDIIKSRIAGLGEQTLTITE